MKGLSIVKIASIAALAAVAQGANAQAVPNGGTVRFIGNIVDAPCSIAPNSADMEVQLGSVSAASLSGGAGKKSAPARFTIDLLNCGATADGATVTFTGTANSTNNDLLAIVGSGAVGVAAATGVGIELGDSAGTPIALGATSGEYRLSQGDNSLRFQARYVSTLPAVTAGPANSMAQFTVTYL